MATEYTDKLSISVTLDSVKDKVTKHLAVIGKRAKDVQGKSMFSDLTVSSNEKDVFDDIIKSGAETIVNELAPFCGEYVFTPAVSQEEVSEGTTDSVVDGGGISTMSLEDAPTADTLSFVITAKRWTDSDADTDEDNNKNLVKALKEAVANYLYNFTLAQYLSIIHPSTGEKYPPIFGSTYNAQCAVIIGNIIGLCNLKRPSKASTKSYADMGYLVKLAITAVEVTLPRTGISNATIKIDGVTCADGSAEVVANKSVSYSVSATNHATKTGTIKIDEDTDIDVALFPAVPVV